MIGAQAGPQKCESPTAIGLAQHESKTDNEILSDLAEECKSFGLLQARARKHGFGLVELSTGGFLVSRSDRSAHCSSLDSVRVFLGSVAEGRA